MIDPSLRRRSKSSDQRENWDEKGPSSPIFMKGKNNIGINVTTARKHYSLAPCSHLFVSWSSTEFMMHLVNLLCYDSTLNVWKRSAGFRFFHIAIFWTLIEFH